MLNGPAKFCNLSLRIHGTVSWSAYKLPFPYCVCDFNYLWCRRTQLHHTLEDCFRTNLFPRMASLIFLTGREFVVWEDGVQYSPIAILGILAFLREFFFFNSPAGKYVASIMRLLILELSGVQWLFFVSTASPSALNACRPTVQRVLIRYQVVGRSRCLCVKVPVLSVWSFNLDPTVVFGLACAHTFYSRHLCMVLVPSIPHADLDLEWRWRRMVWCGRTRDLLKA